MDNINFQICNTEFEPSLRSEPILMVTNLSENMFETIIKNIKRENLPPVPDEDYDFEDAIEEKLFLQDNISTPSSLNVSKSSIQVLENTKLLVTRQRKNNSSTKSHLFSPQISKSVTSSMSIAHICTNNCVWCKTSFAVLDNPNHIGRIRNVDKQNAFLNIISTLKIDSCLCDRCWKFLEKTYKFNKNKNKKGVSSNSNFSIKVDKDFEEESNTMVELITQSSKNFKTRNDQIFSCSVHNCKQEVDLHPLSIEECTKINEILLKADVHTMILIKSHKWGSDERGPISLSVCEEHLQMIRVLTTCQLCANKLGENLNTDYWKMYDQWNSILACNNIPLKLLSGMFLCDTCQSFVSNNEYFSTIDLKSLQQNVKKRNDVCMKLFEVPKNVNVTKKKETVKTKSEDVFKVKFTEPLITSIYYYKSCINNHRFRKRKQKKLARFSKSLDLLTYSTVKSNTNIESSNSETTTSHLVNNEDELSLSIDKNIKHDIKTHYVAPKIEITNEKADIKEENDSLLKNIEKKHQTSTKMYSRHISPSKYHNPKPNKRIRKLMSLVTKTDDLEHIKTSILSKQNKGNSPVSSTKLDADLVLDSMNNHSDDNFSTNKDAGTLKIDTGEDLLHVSPNQLDKDKVEMFEDEHNSSKMPLVDSVFSLLSDQTVCVASDEKTDDCTPLTISQPSVQSSSNGVYNRNEIFEDRKTNNSMSLVDSMSSLLSDQTVCVASDGKNDDCNSQASSQHSAQSSSNRCVCNKIEMFEDRTVENSMPIVDSAFSSSSNQTVCRANDEKTADCTSLTISQPSVQSHRDVCNTNDKETKKCPELISQQNIADQSESISDSDHDYEYLSEEESNFKRKDLNELVQYENVLHPIKLDNLRVDPVKIKKRLCNVVNQRIKKTKKQRLNERHVLNNTFPYKSDNQTNSSYIDVEDSSFESYKYININHQIPNLPRVLSLFSKNTNDNVFNCNYSDVGVQNISYDEKTIMSIDPDDTQSRNSDEVEEIIMSNDPADVQNIFNNESEEILMSNDEVDVQNIINDEDEEMIMSNNPADVQNISNNKREEIIMSNDQADLQYISSDEETVMSNYQNCMNNSSPDGPLLQIESVSSLEPSLLQLDQTSLKIPHCTKKNTCPGNEDKTDTNKTVSDDEFSLDSCESQCRINEFPRLPKVNTNSAQQNKKENYHELRFEVNNSNEYIYRDLLAKFGDPSAVISYLMENERLLFSGKLVISDTTRPHAANYLKKHLDVLNEWYGDAEDNDLSESFISASYPEARLYSQRLSSDIPNLSKSDDASISTCSSPSSQNFLSSPTSSDYSINCVPEVKEEVISPTFFPYNFSPIMTNQTVDASLQPIPNQSPSPADICLTPSLKIDQCQSASVNQLPTTVRSKEKSKSHESLSIDTYSSQNPLSSPSSSEDSINYIPEITSSFSSCMPIMSNQAVNALLLTPKQSRPPTAIHFSPNSKIIQRQSAPFFQLPTAVRSQIIRPTRPYRSNPHTK